MTSMNGEGFIPFLRKKAEKKTARVIGWFRRQFGMCYRSALSEADLFEMLRGKSVALVGNALSLAERDCGAAIDACDIIIRCNRAPIPDVRSHGARTTFIATSIELPEEIMAERGASHILWMSPPRNALPAWIVRWPNFFLYPKARHEALNAKVPGRPTTGLMVIDLLARSRCRAVALYGFDFFKSQSLSGERDRTQGPHDFDAEERFVRALVAKDRRFSLN
ncbi:glycosyltransferase family 29 protein [Rhizobium sp. LCM 4573]|uniref:glycosyltransferase family 29 protein n=1 Tax=Rhizobium sp. LCM 4573 TaxID=1848291 RepID=UPI0009F2EDA5|nr:glycosyltransferase family 29 protein [Rhizobium sp. LCM 4573]